MFIVGNGRCAAGSARSKHKLWLPVSGDQESQSCHGYKRSTGVAGASSLSGSQPGGELRAFTKETAADDNPPSRLLPKAVIDFGVLMCLPYPGHAQTQLTAQGGLSSEGSAGPM